MLKYIGDGAALIGVPARDLTDEEAEQFGGEAFLLAPHPMPLYERAGGEKPARKSGKAALAQDDAAAIKQIVNDLEEGD